MNNVILNKHGRLVDLVFTNAPYLVDEAVECPIKFDKTIQYLYLNSNSILPGALLQQATLTQSSFYLIHIGVYHTWIVLKQPFFLQMTWSEWQIKNDIVIIQTVPWQVSF